MREKIQKAIEKVRPHLQRDGGDIELVDVVDGIVKVRLKGACMGCPMSQITLQEGVARVLKKEVPEIVRLEAVN